MVNETLRFLMAFFLMTAVLFLLAATLTSCSELKYVECVARDNSRNPCN